MKEFIIIMGLQAKMQEQQYKKQQNGKRKY